MNENGAAKNIADVVEKVGKIRHADLLSQAAELVGACENWDEEMVETALNSVLLKLETFKMVDFDYVNGVITWVGQQEV